MEQKRVVIIGMGFGGLEAARALAGSGLEVLALDRRNFHLFQPLLYQVATAMLDQETVAHSIRAIVRRWKGVRFQMSEVQGIDFAARQVLTGDGPIAYDYLVIAAGSVTNFFGNTQIQQNAFDLKQLHDAVALRNHILSAYERAAKEADPALRQALMTFVIVGGGPTGVEFAGALSELTQHVLSKDFPDLPVAQSRIVLVEASDHILSPFPPRLRRYALRRLQQMKVEVRLNGRVTGVEDGRVLLKDDAAIASHTLFWGAGVRAAPLADAIDVPKVRGARVSVEPDLSLQAHREVFVVGDMAHLEQDGAPLPMLAPVAMQQGEYVGKLIAAREAANGAQAANGTEAASQQPAPFRYFDKGTMAVIGRYSAVAQTKGATFTGVSAWLAWLGLHLYYLIGFRNRLAAMVNWSYSFLLYDQQVRLITAESKKPGDDSAPAALGVVPAAQTVQQPQSVLSAAANVVPHAEVTADAHANPSQATEQAIAAVAGNVTDGNASGDNVSNGETNDTRAL